MLRDAARTKKYLRFEDKLPQPVNFGHPVADNPTGSPAYIDGQVADILVEIQEKPMAKFVEGEQVGTLPPEVDPTVFGIDKRKFDSMMDRVFVRHKKLSRASRRLPYTLLRMADGKQFHLTWLPEHDGFRVVEVK